MKRIIPFLLCVSLFLMACKNQDNASAITVQESTPTIQEEEAPKDPYEKNKAISLIMSFDEDIDTDFATALYDSYKEALFNVIKSASETNYDKKLWYEQTGKSIHVLRDELSGILTDEALMKENKIHLMETSSSDKVHLGFAGDVSLAPDYSHAQAYESGGIDYAFPGDIQKAMKEPDIFMVNNEFCYSNRGAPQPGKTYTFRSPPERVNWLFEMGVDTVSLANNHAFDYGQEAFDDTLKTLEDANMPYFGGGHNIKDAAKPTYFIANGIKIAYLSATEIEGTGVIFSKEATEENGGLLRFNDPTILCESIKEAKANSDFVIVIPHWGTERIQELQEHEQYMGKILADAGADVIIGGHPHVIQGVEYYNDIPIFYSLGNFFFNDRIMDSCILYLNISIDGIESAQFLPCIEASGQTIMVDKGSDSYNRIIDEFNRYSASGITVDEDGMVMYFKSAQ